MREAPRKIREKAWGGEQGCEEAMLVVSSQRRTQEMAAGAVLDQSQRKMSEQELKAAAGTSLAVQWLENCLPMQGTQVPYLSRKIPHALEQLSLCAAN